MVQYMDILPGKKKARGSHAGRARVDPVRRSLVGLISAPGIGQLTDPSRLDPVRLVQVCWEEAISTIL